jgi:hypothetical protein
MYFTSEEEYQEGKKVKVGDGNVKDGNGVDFTEVNLSDVNTVDLGI